VLRVPLSQPLFLLGALFVAVVYLLPGGVARLPERIRAARNSTRPPAAGAFVAAVAARYSGRVASLVLVDGGLGFPAPTGLDGDELITAGIGPAMARLSMTFPDREAYRSFWQAHPAFGAAWSPWVDTYIQRDLVGHEPEFRSSCRIDAVRADAGQLFDAETLGAIRRLECPSELLWAEGGRRNPSLNMYRFLPLFRYAEVWTFPRSSPSAMPARDCPGYWPIFRTLVRTQVRF
jgi:pimeloyl-ACP methyl ester carboxylesterase